MSALSTRTSKLRNSTPHRLLRHRARCELRLKVLLLCWLASSTGTACGQEMQTAKWWRPYSQQAVDGAHVLGLWRFDSRGSEFAADSSGHNHRATVRGAKWSSEGRFGGCLESGPGFPVTDTSHAIHVARSPILSPASAFSWEMWVRPHAPEQFLPTLSPTLIDSKYVHYDHRGLMWSLTRETGGRRQMTVAIGLGDHSTTWYSKPFPLKSEEWQHLAFVYDARGTVTFFVNGSLLSRTHHDNAGPMASATRDTAIGDRLGSNYRGFSGRIDEVRLTAGQRDYRPFQLVSNRPRIVVRRAAKDVRLTLGVKNRTDEPLKQGTIEVRLPFQHPKQVPLEATSAGDAQPIDVALDTRLKPGEYEIAVVANVHNWPQTGSQYEARFTIPLVITPRPLPHPFPVIMWGVGGVDNVVREIPRLKSIGFTHCLGLKVDYQRVWDGKDQATAGTDDDIQQARVMLDTALEHDLQVVATLSPGHWLRTAQVGKPFHRVDRSSKPYPRTDVSGLFPRVQEFCYDVGQAVGRAYGDHPAFAAALLHTEVRGASEVSFHPLEVAALRRDTGLEIPAVVRSKRGVDYRRLDGFPATRVVADDDPILKFYRWFWERGDGWNGLTSQLAAGLDDTIGRDEFWTFYDPAVRVPSMRGSGGKVDILSHWTYSYPDPIRIGLCTDELFEMARVNGYGQDVMKMTQIIWYRSQTAPIGKSPASEGSPWVDRDPDAAYITIAPMHLREAFWWKIARPIKGIMYHGWQSLVPTESRSAYRLTNDRTRDELARLARTIIQPLGPTLKQIPDPPTDVAFLESFTSQMFARRGTYGWNHSWAGDVYHVLMYAQLQPRILYEESLLDGGLQGVRVLVMPDCDVLPRSVVDAVTQFQQGGGIIIGDAELCPAIKPDFILSRIARTKKADVDKAQLQELAKKLRRWLDQRYQRPADSSNPDVLVRRRRFASTDYVFAVNDRRTFGTYVGQYGLVMEDGLPSSAKISLRHDRGYVYDLVSGQAINATLSDNRLEWSCDLGPCQGRIWMITQRPIRQVDISAPETSRRGDTIEVHIAVTDGSKPVDAVVPLEVRIIDPEGAAAEFSGYYGAADGTATIRCDFAPNDRLGVWQIEVGELASGKRSATYIHLTK